MRRADVTAAWLARRRVEIPEDGAPGAKGEQGPAGPAGPQGPQGDVGPMPRHEFRYDGGQVRIRFEQGPEPGHWGEWSENLRGPRGSGAAGLFFGGTSQPAAAAATVPVFIPQGETFVVPPGQTLFTMAIDCEGIIEVDGFLVQV